MNTCPIWCWQPGTWRSLLIQGSSGLWSPESLQDTPLKSLPNDQGVIMKSEPVVMKAEGTEINLKGVMKKVKKDRKVPAKKDTASSFGSTIDQLLDRIWQRKYSNYPNLEVYDGTIDTGELRRPSVQRTRSRPTALLHPTWVFKSGSSSPSGNVCSDRASPVTILPVPHHTIYRAQYTPPAQFS